MTCNIIPHDMKVPESLNSNILRTIMSLPDGVRKEVRLLAKQYHILEVYREPPVMCDDIIVREEPYKVRYKHFCDDSEEFIWLIDANRME